MPRGGARHGAGRKAFPLGTRRVCQDGRILEKRRSGWVRVGRRLNPRGRPVLKSSAGRKSKRVPSQMSDAALRPFYLEYRRRRLREWRARP